MFYIVVSFFFLKFIDETSLWDVVVGLQSTFGSFPSISVPSSILSSPSEVHRAIEATEFQRPTSAETEKCVNEVPIIDIIERFRLLIDTASDFFVFKGMLLHIFRLT